MKAILLFLTVATGSVLADVEVKESVSSFTCAEAIKSDIPDETGNYKIIIEGDFRSIYCNDETGQALFSDFGERILPVKAIAGEMLTHGSVLAKAGWEFEERVWFNDPLIEPDADFIQFFAAGLQQAVISHRLPSWVTEVEVHLKEVPIIPAKMNRILHRKGDKETVLWVEGGGSERIVLSLPSSGGELLLEENSGLFMVDKIWVR